MPKFVEDHDANRMLSGSVISIGGRLIYVNNVSRQMLTGVDIETGEAIDTPADFDVIKNPNAGRLGYMNTPNGCSYMLRSPVRTMAMGFNSQNTKAYVAHNTAGRRAPVSLIGSCLKYLNNTYKNIFPDYKEAYKLAIETQTPTAFDRSFAVDRNGILFFRGNAIGRANPDREDLSDFNRLGKAVQKVRNIPKLNWRAVV